MIRRETCRISGEKLTPLFSLGDLYVSDFLADGEQPVWDKTPLEMCIGKKSGLVQLRHTADFDSMYKRYWYRSGTNASMTNELNDIVDSVLLVKKIDEDSTWVDIGCNDGTMFKFIPEHVHKVGFDPTEDSVKFAPEHCDKYFNTYFTADKMVGGPKADVITSIAMFYDLEDPHEFVNDVYSVLDDNGVWVIQMSYLPLMLEQLAFDNICHEHLEYYSLECLEGLLVGHGFRVVDFQVNPTNGGSCRVYVMKNKADVQTFGTAPFRDVANFRVWSALNYEQSLDLRNEQTYQNFFDQINILKSQTVGFIDKAFNEGKTICGYGASTKGNTLLQYFGLDSSVIKGIAERQERKVGLRTIGTDIPIYSEEHVREYNPDYMLVLPWHFIYEFKQREANYLNNGGKFIVPCPNFEVVA